VKKKAKEADVFVGSGNVFADLGLKDADELLFKANLAREMSRAIRALALTQKAAAAALGIDQPKISRIERGDFYGISAEQLMRFLTVLGRDVSVMVRARKKKGPGKLTVQATA
jgi:predicted XRE-type DNA-binding protein